jgi:hypothetical protein
VVGDQRYDAGGWISANVQPACAEAFGVARGRWRLPAWEEKRVLISYLALEVLPIY